MEHIIIKVNTLNDFYSAGVLDKEIIPLSKHIYELNIDEKLKSEDLTVVDDILKAKDVRRVYSFATKYCSHHNPEVYPIYDSYVKKVLMNLKKQDKFAEFTENGLKDYETFNEVLDEFKVYYGLEYSKKELDQYLWLLGIHTFKKSSIFTSSSKSNTNHQ